MSELATKLKVKYRNKTFIAKDATALYNRIITKFPDADKLEVESVISRFSGTDLYVKRDKPETPEGHRNIRFEDAKKGAMALLKLFKGETVSQLEINRRSSICTNCPMLATTTDCYGCGFAGRLQNFIKDLKKTVFKSKFDIPNGLSGKYCKVCSCALSMMLPSKMSAFDESLEKQNDRPNHCWVKKTSTNYVESE